MSLLIVGDRRFLLGLKALFTFGNSIVPCMIVAYD
jgi:hypothetical protein